VSNVEGKATNGGPYPIRADDDVELSARPVAECGFDVPGLLMNRLDRRPHSQRQPEGALNQLTVEVSARDSKARAARSPNVLQIDVLKEGASLIENPLVRDHKASRSDHCIESQSFQGPYSVGGHVHARASFRPFGGSFDDLRPKTALVKCTCRCQTGDPTSDDENSQLLHALTSCRVIRGARSEQPRAAHPSPRAGSTPRVRISLPPCDERLRAPTSCR
jgi:hypothetical protein